MARPKSSPMANVPVQAVDVSWKRIRERMFLLIVVLAAVIKLQTSPDLCILTATLTYHSPKCNLTFLAPSSSVGLAACGRDLPRDSLSDWGLGRGKPFRLWLLYICSGNA